MNQEPKEELFVDGSEEDVEEPPEADSDEDFIDEQKQFQEELEGSVDEGSTKSGEEYDALAMQDIPNSGYASEDEEFVSKMDSHKMVSSALRDQTKDNEFHDLFETKTEPLSESLKHATLISPFTDNTERRVPPPSVGHRYRKRSLSIPSFGKRGASTTTTNEALRR